MTAEAKTLSLFLLMLAVALALVVWADYSALVALFDRVGQSLDAIPAGQR